MRERERELRDRKLSNETITRPREAQNACRGTYI